MFKNLLQAVFDFTPEKVIPSKIKLFSDFMLTHQIIRTVNECDEDIYIATEKEQDRNLHILVTKCKRLLSFVECHGLEYKYTSIIADFGNEIEYHVQRKLNIDHLFEKFGGIEKKIKGKYDSVRNLSNINST
tara:strand:- start:1581 stop:1976 length:396 start_codon:yes stop_codon:yes gene_type:complete